MSILIKGMNKPTACYKCQLKTGKYCGILTENEKCADDGVLPHCPIVEAPTPHGRLIDKDKLEDVFWDILNEPEKYDKPLHCMMLELQTAPTVIESEEQEHDN